MRPIGAALLALWLVFPTTTRAEEAAPDDPETGEETVGDDGEETADEGGEDLEERVRQLEEELRALKELLGAQEAPDEAGEPPELSEAELAEIEAALAADAEAVEESVPPTAPRTFAASTQSMNPDISFIADVVLAWFSADEPMQSGGHDPNKNGFNLQQLELSVSKAVDPYFEFDANIVFTQYGVEIEEVYATTLGLPLGLQVRAGQFLTRFGRINNSHPHAWDFVDQSFAVGRVFGGEGNRGLGAEASILMPFPWYFELVGSGTMAGGASTARSFFGANDLGVKTPADFQGTAAVKQFFPLGPDHSLFWGVSFAGGPNSTGRSNRTEVYGSDLYYKWRPVSRGGFAVVSLQAEVFWRRQQVPGDVLQDVSLYAQLFWRFAQRWAVAGRYEYGSPRRTWRARPWPIPPTPPGPWPATGPPPTSPSGRPSSRASACRAAPTSRDGWSSPSGP